MVSGPAPIWPFQGFVDASDGQAGMAVVTRGLPECECLTDEDGNVVLAVTLLRCVEWISRGDLLKDVSLLELENGPALISSVKKAEAGDVMVVRLHNPTSDGVNATLVSRVPVERVNVARLDETPGERLRVVREAGPCRAEIRSGPKQIVTVLLYSETLS